MKKLLIISIAVLGLGIVSCQKQEIAPNTSDLEVPVWEESARIGDDDDDDDDGTIGEITDPNHENDDPPSDDNNKTKDGEGDNRQEGGN